MKKLLGLLAFVGLVAIASPHGAAAGVLTPGAAKTMTSNAGPLATEVQYRRHRHHDRGYYHRRHRVVVPHVVVRRAIGPRHHHGYRHYRRY